MNENTSPRRARRPREDAHLGSRLLNAPPIRNHLKPIEPMSVDQVMAVHEASLKLLLETGIEFMGPAARVAFRQAGAEVDDASGLVRIPRALVEKALATAPSSFTLTPRNPARTIEGYPAPVRAVFVASAD